VVDTGSREDAARVHPSIGHHQYRKEENRPVFGVDDLQLCPFPFDGAWGVEHWAETWSISPRAREGVDGSALAVLPVPHPGIVNKTHIRGFVFGPHATRAITVTVLSS
jgi:hypothetical protein